MKPKFLITTIVLTIFVFIISCNSSDNKTQNSNATGTSDNTGGKTDTSTSAASTGNEKSGVGKFQHVELTHPLDKKMIATGKGIYDLKCGSCHKLTDEKLVGPGWKGVTDRRTPEWIMNFVTNTEEMLAKNDQAKNLYEICLIKMPNQNLSDDDARSILEFQRNNDGKK
ncbi:MAG: c-type cytochrome [Chitinophagales bacterium]